MRLRSNLLNAQQVLTFLPVKSAVDVSETINNRGIQMTDSTKYKSVAVKYLTYDQLKDLSIYNATPISRSAMVAHLVDKEWRQMFTTKKPKLFTFASLKQLFSRSSSEH